MSKFKAILSVLGLGSQKAPAIPQPVIPAPPAPVRRTDTGAAVVVGADDVKNQRVSGTRRTSTGSGLSGLGRGSGISI